MNNKTSNNKIGNINKKTNKHSEDVVNQELINKLDEILAEDDEEDFELPDFNSLHKHLESCDCGPHTFCENCMEACFCGECPKCHSEGIIRIPAYLDYNTDKLDRVDEKRIYLENYVNDLIKRVGGNAKYSLRSNDRNLSVRAEIKGTRVKGLSGLVLSVDTFYKSPPIIRVDGTYQNLTSQKDSYIEIGNKCLYVVNTKEHVYLQHRHQISKHLLGTHLKLLSDNDFYGLLSMNDALTLLKIFPIGTRIQGRGYYTDLPIKYFRFDK